jgi:hypothetical protein
MIRRSARRPLKHSSQSAPADSRVRGEISAGRGQRGGRKAACEGSIRIRDLSVPKSPDPDFGEPA